MEEPVDLEEPVSQPRSRSVAARVAARYAQAPTYSEMLAQEARNAARAAEAAAVAAGEARDAAQAILVGLDADMHEIEERRASPVEEQLSSFVRRQSQPPVGMQNSPLPQPRWRPFITEATDETDFNGPDEEPIAPVQPLPANLLEFPRELIATRKARPRLAEGPLREEYDRDAERSQLRIFEVAPETISTEPVLDPVLPEWVPIRLDYPAEAHSATRARGGSQDHHFVSHPADENTVASFELPLQVASLEDRLMAGLVDAGLIAAGFLVFAFVFVACTAHPPTGKPAQIGAGVALFAFAAIYQLLFFNFGSDTPGMRYAKIALCTFDDESPTRQGIRRRLGAVLLSASPMGLGILWAFFDDDRLGWHDRISRTYQRSYR
jgi:uncharacterized RDD family membrane protein YckC